MTKSSVSSFPEISLEIDESAVDIDLLRAVLMEKTKPSTREGYTKDLVDFFLFVTQGESVYEIEGPKRKSEIKAQVKGELSRLSQSFVGQIDQKMVSDRKEVQAWHPDYPRCVG